MKKRDEILQRLFRAAAEPEIAPEMPFGFDTRVLAIARQFVPGTSAVIALFARRAVAISLAIIALASAGVYGVARSERNAELTNEYGIVDSAIQSNLGE